MIDGVIAQAGLADLMVQPALCFVDTEIPLFAPERVGGVILCTPKTLRRRLVSTKSAGLSRVQVSRVVEVLTSTLRPAGS